MTTQTTLELIGAAILFLTLVDTTWFFTTSSRKNVIDKLKFIAVITACFTIGVGVFGFMMWLIFDAFRLTR